MGSHGILSEYFGHALDQAEYDKLEDNTYCGRIKSCTGVIAFASTLRECEDELRSTLEEWVLLGLKLKHPLPEINGINLNQEPQHEQLESLPAEPVCP